MRDEGRRHAIRKLVRAPKVAQLPPSYQKVISLAANPSSIDEAMTQWYTIARKEFGNIAGDLLQD